VRIVIDARPALDPRRTGVGRYTRQLIRHLPFADPSSEIVAWYLHAKGLFRHHRFFDDGAANLTERASRFPARVFEPVASRVGMPKVEWLTGPFDAVIGTNFLPPATASEGAVLVVHDLAFERFPETAPQIDARWRRRFDRWLKRCSAVIVPSASTRDDLMSMHRVPEARVHVVHHGIEPFSTPKAEKIMKTKRRFHIDGPYVFFLGGIEPRKNLHALVEAFSRVATDDAGLVIAGGPVRWIPQAEVRLREMVAELPEGVRRRIVFTGYVADEHANALMAGAEVLAYPSLYEGFGFPVLEAMSAGVPVLTSDASSLLEVAGDAAVLVDPHDTEAITDGLRRLLRDEELRARLRAAGLERVRAFTWPETARRTAEVLHGGRPSSHG
jgi:glycosyltransferase involved in cell wall biosynthesis